MANKLRDKILNAKDQETQLVKVKQWDVEILVKGMNGAERDELLQNAIDQKTGVTNMKKMNTSLVIECSYDPETDEKIFEEADADLIQKKSAGALFQVVKVATKLSGLDDVAEEEATKN